jgi:hypothetical protein
MLSLPLSATLRAEHVACRHYPLSNTGMPRPTRDGARALLTRFATFARRTRTPTTSALRALVKRGTSRPWRLVDLHVVRVALAAVLLLLLSPVPGLFAVHVVDGGVDSNATAVNLVSIDVRAAKNERQQRDVRRLSRLPVIITGPLAGGVGNQIEVALQHLGLARKHRLDYYFPPMRTRTKLQPLNAGSVWDLTSLSGIVRRIHTRIPAACDTAAGGKFDVRVLVDIKAPPSNTSMTVQKRSLTAKTGVVVNIGRRALDGVGNLREEIQHILLQRPAAALAEDAARTAICVHLGIHSARSDSSLAPFLRPNSRVQRIAKMWPLDTMGVMHLRHDESREGCGRGPPRGVDPLQHVCLLRNGVLDTLWVPHGVYADRAARELRRNGVQHVYMTRSKYMPEASWNNLGRRMRAERQLQVVDSASTHYEEEELNYVEREIATRSRYFIAEARSTWSKTVVWSRNNSETFVQAIDLFEEHSSYGAAGV